MSHRSGGFALTVCAPAALALAALFAAACGQGEPAPEEAIQVPEPDMTDMEPQVAKRLRETRAAVLAEPRSAAAWGRFGMVTHAHELWEEAAVAYRQAEKLDPGDVRWPYYLGDVLSVVGTDLEAAERGFRRAVELRAGYAPAHLRLGRVLFAAGQNAAAAAELERALELEPSLQPAQVTLAQARLAAGELDRSAELLEKILEEKPGHAQALATLGQVYMRQGKRDEAREIAERARDGDLYNLYSDPLMSQVVAEGVSSLQIWDRAKAFFENGNYEQAMLGLRQVVALKPENPDVHQQLAVAYGNLGDLKRSRHHLERSVVLAPERVDSLIQLATLELEQQDPVPAIGHLRRILELAPDDPDARWLLGKAQVLTGDLRAALASFEEAAAAGGGVPATGAPAAGMPASEVPSWARNDWGSALAQSGRPYAALDQFRAALAAEPDNAQALFYTGLVLEGLGRADEAVEHYCRSLRAEPNPPARARLQALGRRCG